MDENVQHEITLACINDAMIIASTSALVKQQLAAKKQMWETAAQRSDLTSEQHAQLAEALEYYRGFHNN